MAFGPLKVGSLVYGRVEVVTLTGVLSNASLPPMTRDKVEAIERVR